MSSIQLPKDTFKDIQKPDCLLIISFLVILIGNLVSILALTIDLKLKVIFCLCIISFVFLVDIVVLYTQYFKFHYQFTYYNKIYSILDSNMDSIGEKFEKLNIESTNLKQESEKLKSEISNIKAEISNSQI